MTATSPDPTGLPYHRMARYSPHHRWWRPLLGTVVLVVGSVLVAGILYALVDGIGWAAGYPELPDGGTDFGPIANTGLDLAFIALDLPLVLLVVLWLGRRPAGTVASVTGRPRWGWLGWCLLAAVPPMVLLPVVAGFLPGDEGDGGGSDVWAGWQTFLVSLAMLAVLVPLQSAAEEYVFRGWLLQAAGAYLRSPWLAVLPQAVLFAAAHGWGTPWGFADLLVFAVVAGLLTIRTGGLEASMALHALNNLLAFGVSAAYVDGLASDETAADASWQLALIDMASVLLFAAIVLRLARRRHPQHLSAPPPEPTYAPPQGAYWPYGQVPGAYGSGAYGPYPQQPGAPWPYPQQPGAPWPYPQQPGAPWPYPQQPGGHGVYAPPPGAPWPYAPPQGNPGPYPPPPPNATVPGPAAAPGAAPSGPDAPHPVAPGDAPSPDGPGAAPSGADGPGSAVLGGASGAAASGSAAPGAAPGPVGPSPAARGAASSSAASSSTAPGAVPGPAVPGDAHSPAGTSPAVPGAASGPGGPSPAARGAASSSAASSSTAPGPAAPGPAVPGDAHSPAGTSPAAPGDALSPDGISPAAPAPAEPSSQQPGGAQES
ncbi:type II CAAX prenyl endopeptidase Rce1 family protein [Streptomyces sp. NPDC058440]|uniref:CPBP family glutamic-type intramembrane protease n=1 Tax=Streptomyces sp. NPDC058440 TaxID=3346501 RepID=UPI0036491112